MKDISKRVLNLVFNNAWFQATATDGFSVGRGPDGEIQQYKSYIERNESAKLVEQIATLFITNLLKNIEELHDSRDDEPFYKVTAKLEENCLFVNVVLSCDASVRPIYELIDDNMSDCFHSSIFDTCDYFNLSISKYEYE